MTWKDELRKIPAPEPSMDLLERILASRAAGVRVVLPEGRATVSRRTTLLLLTAAAAALVLVMSTRGGDHRSVDTENELPDITAGLSLWPPDALAQEPGPPRRPRYEPVRSLLFARVQGGMWTYRTCTVFDDVLTNCRGRLTIAVSQGKWEGRPAWLVSQQNKSVRDWATTDTIRTPLDTTYVDPATLRPIYHAINGKAFHFVRRITGDTVHEALDIGGTAPRSWRSSAGIPGAQDAPLVLRWARVDVTLLLQVLPLDRSWRGSVYSVGLVGPDPSKTAFAPVDLRVVGSGRIDVPAGRFECWKLELQVGLEDPLILWASKDRGWLIKTEQRGLDWRTESVLVSAIPPTP